MSAETGLEGPGGTQRKAFTLRRKAAGSIAGYRYSSGSIADLDISLLEDQRTALLPSGELWDEVGGRGELDVDAKAVLDRGQMPQQHVCIGVEADIDIDR
jgi:hypothetical protein